MISRIICLVSGLDLWGLSVGQVPRMTPSSYTPELLWVRDELSSSSDPPLPLSLADPKL